MAGVTKVIVQESLGGHGRAGDLVEEQLRGWLPTRINAHRCSLNLINLLLSMNAKLIGPNHSACH